MMERKDKEAFKQQLKMRTKAFAVEVFNLVDQMPKSPHPLHEAIVPLLKESDELVRLFSAINRSAKSPPRATG